MVKSHFPAFDIKVPEGENPEELTVSIASKKIPLSSMKSSINSFDSIIPNDGIKTTGSFDFLTPKEEEPTLSQKMKAGASETGKIAMSLIAPLVAFPVSMVAGGIRSIQSGSSKEGDVAEEEAYRQMTDMYRPDTKEGQKLLESIGKVFAVPNDVAKEMVEMPLESWKATGAIRYLTTAMARLGGYMAAGKAIQTGKGVVKDVLGKAETAITAGAKEKSLGYTPLQETPVTPDTGRGYVPPVVTQRTTPLTEEPKPLDTAPKDMLERVQMPVEETLKEGKVEEIPATLETDTGRPTPGVRFEDKVYVGDNNLHSSAFTAMPDEVRARAFENMDALETGWVDKDGNFTRGDKTVIVDPENFIKIREKSTRPQFLTEYTADELKDMTLRQVPGKDAIYAIKSDGDLVNVINASGEKGLGKLLVEDAIKNGAVKLDAFDGYLTREFYPKFNFEEIGRDPWNEEYRHKKWLDKDGKPDVVYMRLKEIKNENISRQGEELAKGGEPSGRPAATGANVEINRIADSGLRGAVDYGQPEPAGQRVGVLRGEYVARPLADILSDINTAFGERGSIGGKELSDVQIAARARLKADLERFATEAKQAGKDLESHMLSMGFSPEAIERLIKEIPVATKIPEAAPQPPTAKQPWEMTRDEFERQVPVTPISKTEASVPVESGMRFRFNVPRDVEDIVGYARERVIRRAVNEGQTIPPEVLKDYPDLKPPIEGKGEYSIRKAEPAKEKIGEATPEAVSKPLEKPSITEAAKKGEELLKEQKETAITNSFVDEQRASRGKEPIESPLRGMPDWEKTKADVDNGTIDPKQIAKDVASGKLTPTPEHKQALLYDKMKMSVRLDNLYEDLAKARSEKEVNLIASTREHLSILEREYDMNEQATKTAASEWGIMGNVMQQLAKEDYSLARIMQRARATSPNGEVPKQFEAKMKNWHSELLEAKKKLAEYEDRLSKEETAKVIESIKRNVNFENRQLKRTYDKQTLDIEFKSLVADFNKAVGGIHMGIPVEGVPIIVKMAENRIRSGLISAEGMIDYIYTELGERFSKGDIRDALRKYGVAESTEPLKRKKAEAAPKVDPEIKRIETRVKTLNTMIDNLRKKIDTGDISVQKKELKTPSTPEIRELEKTRDELNATLNKMRKEAQPRKTTEEIKSKAYETRLQKQKAMLEGQLETGVFTKPEKTKLVLNEKQLGLKADVERLKTKIDDEIRKQDFQNMSGMDKFYHYTNKWRRAVILSSVTTLGKLTSAATQRFISTPMEELAGGILSHIPGISRIAKGAPREGGGMNFKAEAQALRHAFEKATWAASWETVKTGKGPLDYMFGKKNGLPPEALDLFGHMHGALKVFPKTAEFYRSFEKRAEWAARHGLDIKDPNVQMGIMADAYIDSNRAILMNDVLGNTLYRAAIGQAKNAGWAGKAGAFAGQIAVPIVKVPMNFVAETLNYALGTPKGVGQVIYYLINKGAFEKMTAFQKDNVMRSLKKGSLGLALLTIGYSNPEWFGGFYEPGEKRSPDEAKVGGVKVNFPDGTYWHIPRFLLHSPPLEVLQMGATIRRVSDKRDQVMDGMVASVRGIMERTPFFDQIWRGYASMASADKFGMAIAEFLRSMTIPPDSQNLAILLDPNGDEIRKPEDVKDVFKKSIPGLREDVPIKRSGGIQPMKPSKSMLKPMQPNR